MSVISSPSCTSEHISALLWVPQWVLISYSSGDRNDDDHDCDSNSGEQFMFTLHVCVRL